MVKDKKFEEFLELMKENNQLLRFLALSEFRPSVPEYFDEEWEMTLYEMLDGEKTTREIAKNLSKSRLTVLKRLNRWRDQGIVRQVKQGKYDKLASLETLGYEVPEVKEDGEE